MNPGTFNGEIPNPLADLLREHGWFMYDPMMDRSWAMLHTTRKDHIPEDTLLKLLQLGGWSCRASSIIGPIVYLS